MGQFNTLKSAVLFEVYTKEFSQIMSFSFAHYRHILQRVYVSLSWHVVTYVRVCVYIVL